MLRDRPSAKASGVFGGELAGERVELLGVWRVAPAVADGVAGCGARAEQPGGGHGRVASVEERSDGLQRVDGEQGEPRGVGVLDEFVGGVEGVVVTVGLHRQQRSAPQQCCHGERVCTERLDVAGVGVDELASPRDPSDGEGGHHGVDQTPAADPADRFEQLPGVVGEVRGVAEPAVHRCADVAEGEGGRCDDRMDLPVRDPCFGQLEQRAVTGGASEHRHGDGRRGEFGHVERDVRREQGASLVRSVPPRSPARSGSSRSANLWPLRGAGRDGPTPAVGTSNMVWARANCPDQTSGNEAPAT